MEQILLKYGLEGTFILILLGGLKILWHYLQKKDKSHLEERKDWREDSNKKDQRMENLIEDNNKIIREHSNLLSGIKALLENRK